jgi:Tol biopolymer transport system component
MTRIHLFLLCCVCLLVVGCGLEEEGVTAVTPMPSTPALTAAQLPATEKPSLTETAQPTPAPSATPAPATHTPTPPPSSTPAPTATATATAQPTPTPTDTPIPLPPPPGEFYFFLDPDPSDPNTLEQRPPKLFDFHRAAPGVTANEWQIETILAGMSLTGPAITVSPDQTKLALLLLDDTDGDGRLVHNVGGDIRNVYIYDLISHSIERLTNNERSTVSVSWLPDSQAVTYPQSEKVFTTYLDDTVPELVLQLPVNHVGQITWSLDGQKLFLDAVRSTPTTLLAYEPSSGNLSYPDFDTGLGGTFPRWWSPNGRWLAFTQYGAQVYGNWRYVAVMNKESLEVMRLVLGEDYMSSPPDWSMDSQWLAFTKNESVLSLWNTEALTVTDILSGTNMSIPVWSPLENRMAVALVEDGIAKVLTLDPQATMVMEVFQSELYQTIKLFDWSPDGEWLLIFAANEEQSGLHVVHVNSGASYQVMETTRGEPPWELVWLPAP